MLRYGILRILLEKEKELTIPLLKNVVSMIVKGFYLPNGNVVFVKLTRVKIVMK